MLDIIAFFRGNSSDGQRGESAPLQGDRAHLYTGDWRVEPVGLLTPSRLRRPVGNKMPAVVCPVIKSCERAVTSTEGNAFPAHVTTTTEHGWGGESNEALAKVEGGTTIAAVDDDQEQVSFGMPSPSPSPGAGLEEKEARGVQEILNDFGNGRYQLLVFCVCGLAWSADGCLLSALPLSMPFLEEQWSLSPVSQAALLSSIGLGETIGAVGLGALSDRLGRRTTLVLAELLCALFATASFFAQGFWSLLACQVLMGCAVGGSIPIAFSLLVESLADAHKDRVLCLMQAWFKFGMVVDILLGWVLAKYGWRSLMLASGIPALLVLFPLLFLVEESPVHLQNTGNTTEAAKALEKIGRWNAAKLVSGSTDAIKVDYQRLHGHLARAARDEETADMSILTALSSEVTDEDSENSSIITGDTFDPESPAVQYQDQVDQAAAAIHHPSSSSTFRSPLQEYMAIVLQRVTIRTALMWLTINLGSGLYLWYPAIATHMGAGNVGEFGGSLAANLVGIAAFVLAALTTERVGHARLLVGSCLLCAAATVVMSIGVAAGNVATMVTGYVAWMFFFDVAWPVTYAVSPQLFDARTRTTAFGFASGVGKLGVLISPWFRVVAGANLGESSRYLVLVYGLFWVATGYLAFRLSEFMPARQKAED